MKNDLSDEAITARLNQVEQLRQLCLSLSKAEFVKQPSTNNTDVTKTKRPESNNYGDNLRRANK